MLDTVTHQGPITPRLIKGETGLLNKKIMPALHRLQKALLVYEDQVDDEWDRSWYDFAAEWPDIRVDEARWGPSAAEVLRRFLKGHVFATKDNMKDWSGWTSGRLAKLMADMENAGAIVPEAIHGLGEGWMLSQDASLQAEAASPSVFMLHKADALVRSHASELKRRFGDLEVLQYLLIDGRFLGAVHGHWRIGPHDVDDIVLELPARERAARREEVLQAVARRYRQPHTNILKYDGNPVG